MRLDLSHARTRYLATCVGIPAAVLMLLSVVAVDRCEAVRGFFTPPGGQVELDTQSAYSHIRIRRTGNVRTLIFVRDSGEEAWESQVDLDNPQELHFPYLRFLFLSYLLREQQEKVLIVGLGGGSMVHFLQRYDPRIGIDALEIDPVIVKIAQQYFHVRQGGNVNLVTADGFEYLTKRDATYDVIYMDAFLKPSRNTDSTGVPLRLRTLRFYDSVKQRLRPGGLVAFNLNPHSGTEEDVKTIREAFPQVYVFRLPQAEGFVVLASIDPQRKSQADMLRTAQGLDVRWRTSFSFEQMVRYLERGTT